MEQLPESDPISSSHDDTIQQETSSNIPTDNDVSPSPIPQHYITTTSSSAIELKKIYTKDDSDFSNDDLTPPHTIKTKPVIEKSPEGRFHRFDEQLGYGAQKKVYLAYDYDNGREVAWNAIDVSLVEERTVYKIRDEIEILRKLQHPNIISFVFCFYNEIKKEIVIITELFSGGSLKHYLKIYKKPRLRVIKLWCQEILKGLNYLHSSSTPIIHRDIKCDNILINKNTGEVKIGDLGSSCTLNKCGYCKSFSGTAEFCAPEVYIGKYGVRADVYSFGMCLLEIVTNEVPYSECEGNVLLICEKATKQILPLCIYKIQNKQLYDFIMNCLQNENDRPYAHELICSKFLNDLDSEENDYPALEYPCKDVLIKTMKTINFDKKKYASNEIKKSMSTKSCFCKERKTVSPICRNRNSKKMNEYLFYKNKEVPLQSKVSVCLDDSEKNSGDVVKVVLNKRNKGKTLEIKFDFSIRCDTIEGVVNELQKAICLSGSELQDIKSKLHILLSSFSNTNNVKYN